MTFIRPQLRRKVVPVAFSRPEPGTFLGDIGKNNEKKIKKYIGKYNELYKTMAICYGLLRSYIDSTDMAEHDFTLSEIRSFLSTSLFSHLEDDDN